MYLNKKNAELGIEVNAGLTLTLDVFKYENFGTENTVAGWLTLTLDVFKFYWHIIKWLWKND